MYQTVADAKASDHSDPVVSLTFIAADDKETCPLCAHYDGMTMDINDPDIVLFHPPLHDGCRCIAAYNLLSMRADLREVDYVRPADDLLRRHLAPSRHLEPDRKHAVETGKSDCLGSD